MALKGVLFDLDGTLIDSAPDIAGAVNRLMRLNRLPDHSLAAVRGMIGYGIETLVERAFRAHGVQLDPAGLDRQQRRMLEIYGDHLTVRTTLMPGARSALEKLRSCRLRTAVVTNKPEGFSRRILFAFGLMDQVDVVVGGDSGFRKKPAPDMLLGACRALGLAPEDVLMVGDSRADVLSCRAAGVESVVVRGGYAQEPAEELGADRVIDTLHELGDSLAQV